MTVAHTADRQPTLPLEELEVAPQASTEHVLGAVAYEQASAEHTNASPTDVHEFVDSLSRGQHATVRELIQALQTALSESKAVHTPRIRLATKNNHANLAREARSRYVALLSELSGASSDQEDDTYMEFMRWRMFFADHGSEVLAALDHQSSHVTAEPMDRSGQERLDDLGVSWREP